MRDYHAHLWSKSPTLTSSSWRNSNWLMRRWPTGLATHSGCGNTLMIHLVSSQQLSISSTIHMVFCALGLYSKLSAQLTHWNVQDRIILFHPIGHFTWAQLTPPSTIARTEKLCIPERSGPNRASVSAAIHVSGPNCICKGQARQVSCCG